VDAFRCGGPDEASFCEICADACVPELQRKRIALALHSVTGCGNAALLIRVATLARRQKMPNRSAADQLMFLCYRFGERADRELYLVYDGSSRVHKSPMASTGMSDCSSFGFLPPISYHSLLSTPR